MISEIVKYVPSSNTLTVPASLPSGRRCTAAVWDPSGQAAYIIGGSDSSSTPLAAIVKFVPSSNSVSTPASLPAARNCPAAAWAGGSAYIFGGVDGSGTTLGGVIKFTPPSTVTTLSPSGTPGALIRCCHNAVTDGSKVWLLGGFDSGSVEQSSIVQYDISANSVSVLGSSLPSARAFDAAIWDATSSSAYVFGGYPGLNDIVKFTPSSGAVSTVSSPFPSGRGFMSAAYSGSVAYLFGGNAGGTFLSEIRRYAPNNQAPTAIIGSIPTTECTSSAGGPVALSGTSSSDPDGDVLTYSWSAGAGTIANPSAASTTGSFPIGSTSVGLVVTDSWAHQGSASATATVQDSTAPITTATPTGTLGSNGWYRSASVTVSFSAADACSTTTIYRSVDGGASTAGGSVTVTGEGTHSVVYHAQDSRGNIEADKTLSVKIDSVAPSTSASPAGTAGNSPWYVSAVTLTFTATDATSGVAATFCSVDGGAATQGTTCSVSGNGIHNVVYYSTDLAGNQEGSHTTTIRIDTTAPSTTATPAGTVGPGGWYGAAVPVTLSGSDSTSGVGSTNYRIDGGSWTTGTLATVSGNGVHTLEYYSIDVAGNTEATKSLSLSIDTGAPTVTLVEPALGTLYILDAPQATPPLVTTIVGGKTLKATATDSLSGVHHVEFLVDGAVVGTDSSAPYQVFWSGTGTTPGFHTITARAVDQAGNTDEQARQAIVVAL